MGPPLRAIEEVLAARLNARLLAMEAAVAELKRHFSSLYVRHEEIILSSGCHFSSDPVQVQSRPAPMAHLRVGHAACADHLPQHFGHFGVLSLAPAEAAGQAAKGWVMTRPPMCS